MKRWEEEENEKKKGQMLCKQGAKQH